MDRELRQRLNACTGEKSTCGVHNDSAQTSTWSFIKSSEHYSQLLSALNPRGFREMDLLDNMKFIQPRFDHLCDKQKISETVFDLQVQQSDEIVDWDARLREMLLELEEKVKFC